MSAERAATRDEVESLRAELATTREELRSTRRQLLQSEKMAALGQLVAGVAHEISNPVSFIVGNLGPLGRTLASVEAAAERHDDAGLSRLVMRLRRMLETVGHGADRTATIVQDLRRFSRAGETERALYDVHEGLEMSLRLLKPKWHERVTIERDHGVLPPVRVAAGQIDQVLMNLLANACDAIVEPGVLHISTRHDGDTVRIVIADDGVGIPEDVLARIFEPFFTTKPEGQGTGLGLSISQAIVEEHGGRLEVESRVGVGTVFTVVLPIDPS